jgi:hypothetical protein
MQQDYLVKYISTNTTTNLAAAGRNSRVHTVILPKNSTGTVTFQDKTGSPVTQFVLPTSTVAGTYILDVVFGNGLDVVTSAADTVIVTYYQY